MIEIFLGMTVYCLAFLFFMIWYSIEENRYFKKRYGGKSVTKFQSEARLKIQAIHLMIEKGVDFKNIVDMQDWVEENMHEVHCAYRDENDKVDFDNLIVWKRTD